VIKTDLKNMKFMSFSILPVRIYLVIKVKITYSVHLWNNDKYLNESGLKDISKNVHDIYLCCTLI